MLHVELECGCGRLRLSPCGSVQFLPGKNLSTLSPIDFSVDQSMTILSSAGKIPCKVSRSRSDRATSKDPWSGPRLTHQAEWGPHEDEAESFKTRWKHRHHFRSGRKNAQRKLSFAEDVAQAGAVRYGDPPWSQRSSEAASGHRLVSLSSSTMLRRVFETGVSGRSSGGACGSPHGGIPSIQSPTHPELRRVTRLAPR